MEISALARMLYYISAQAGPMPDLSTGACVGSAHADDWHADQHRDARLRAEAKSICNGCPVMLECRKYAMANPSLTGTWGGLTEQDRRRMRRANIDRPQPSPSRRLSLVT
jgi:WhiB family transcriptional regulator, redox-sensing transcriptional regulator